MNLQRILAEIKRERYGILNPLEHHFVCRGKVHILDIVEASRASENRNEKLNQEALRQYEAAAKGYIH